MYHYIFTVVNRNCSIYHILCHSIEGKRVKVNENNARSCEVIIHNAGPEDKGIWKFRTIYTDKSGYQVHPYEHKVKVTVEGTNEYLYSSL